MDESEKEREKDYLNFSINEIEKAKLLDKEDQEIEERLKVLNNYELIFNSINDVYEHISESGGGALNKLRKALDGLEKCSELDDKLSTLCQEIGELFYSLEDKVDIVRDYKEKLTEIMNKNGYGEKELDEFAQNNGFFFREN